MALQSSRQEWQSNGSGGILEGDQDVLTARDLFHGPHEGMDAAV